MTYHLPTGYLLKNRYRIDGIIAQGGFGITYVAQDVIVDSKVCIKELFVAGNSTRGTEQTVQSQATTAFEFKDFLQRFISEAKQLAAFDHKGIVAVQDVFEANQTAYMVMEFVEGQTLKDKVNQAGPLSTQAAFPLLIQLMEAVEEIHRANMLHRDIKPDNIIITPAQRVVLIDFGSARSFSEGKTTTQTTILTPGYAPPEQYSERAPRGAFTDIYALGGTLYFALTGQKPYPVTDRLHEKMPAPHELNPNISTQVSSAIMLALQIKSQDRFQSVTDFKKALQLLSKSKPEEKKLKHTKKKESLASSIQKTKPRSNKKKKKKAAYINTAFLLILPTLLILYFLFFQPEFMAKLMGSEESESIKREETNPDKSPQKGGTSITKQDDYSFISGGYQYGDEHKHGYFICEHLRGKQFNYSIRIANMGGCKGAINGQASMTDKTTALIKHGNCELKLKFLNNIVYINENPDCDQHGSFCTFSGKYLKTNKQAERALKTREKIIRAEQNAPLNYVEVVTSEEANSNLILESVITGAISNTAKYSSYDTFRFQVDYYDRLGSQLGTKYAPFKQIVYPGQSVEYKIKVRMPLKASTFKVKLIEAY